MSSAVVSYFDGLAAGYDMTWTNSGAGRLQRDAVWRELDRFIWPGHQVLDLGCGTGEDAAHFRNAGAFVEGIDSSPRMVEAARQNGIEARVLRIEETGRIEGKFDLVLSNFGALNCVENIGALRQPLARLVRREGILAICTMNRFCLWETMHYGLRCKFVKASRRWSGRSQTSSGLRVFYPSAGGIVAALEPEFRLIRDIGIGVFVPPSYVPKFSRRALERLGSWDAGIAASRIGRAIGDHRLLIFARGR